MAVLKKKLIEQDEVEALKIVDDAIARYSLPNAEINRLINELVSDNMTYAYDGKGDLAQGMAVVVYGATGLMVEGVVLYELIEN